MQQYDWQALLEQMLAAQSNKDVVLRTEQAPQQDDGSKQSSQKTMQNIMDQYLESTKTPSSSGTVPTQGGGSAVGVGGTGQFSGGVGGMGAESGISGGMGGGQFSGGMGAGAPAGGAGGGAGGGGGMAAAAPVAYIAAVIGAQLAASNNTDTVVDGQKTGNVFTGIGDGGWKPSFATEPWLAWGHDKLGWGPTEGDSFDAAVNNSDWDTALKRLPAAADYWADPIRSWVGEGVSGVSEDLTGSEDVGKVLGFVFDPISGILNQIEDWF